MDTFSTRFTDGPDAVVVTIVETVAAITNCEVTDMPPLHAAVDTEALTELVASPREQSIDVTFAYEGCDVTVSSSGNVAVTVEDAC